MKGSNRFNIMQHLPKQALLEVFPNKDFIKNEALNLYSNDDDTGNIVFCFKIIKKQSPKYPFELIPTARQEYRTRHENLIANMTVLKILSPL